MICKLCSIENILEKRKIISNQGIRNRNEKL